MATVIQVRIDDELKAQACQVYDKLGIDLSTAIRMFLKKSVEINGLPFSTINDEITLRALKAMDEMCAISKANGNSEMTLDEINEIIAEVRKERRMKK